MAHPIHHAESSARRYGGIPADYQAIHDWFDCTKQHIATPAHRALRHHAAGIFQAAEVFGQSIVNSDGRTIPVRFIGEQHVREDCRIIPSVSDWLRNLPLEPWMQQGAIREPDPLTDGDLREAWIAAVSRGETVMGLDAWMAECLLVAATQERAPEASVP